MRYIKIQMVRWKHSLQITGLVLLKKLEAASPSWRWIIDYDVEAQFEHSRWCIGYWQSKWRDGLMPMRSDLDPISIGWLIKNLFIVELDVERNDFVYSFIGHEIVTGFGVDNNKATVAETFADKAECQTIRDTYRYIFDSARPYTCSGQVWAKNGAWATFEAVHLPVREQQAGQSIVGAMFFIDSVDEETV